MSSPRPALSALAAALCARATRPLTLAVHVGAGDAALALEPALAGATCVLIEGDPEAAGALRERLGHAPVANVSVVEAIVAPTEGPVLWHRFNVPRLSGLMADPPLRAIYPRARCEQVYERPALALSSLLQQAVGDQREIVALLPDDDRLLVLDLPGQVGPLLSSLGDSDLQAFTWIVCASSHDAIGERLAGAHFHLVTLQADESAGYVVYRLSRSRLAQHLLAQAESARLADRAASEQRVADAEQRLSAMELDLNRATAEAAEARELRKNLVVAVQEKADADRRLAVERDEALRQQTAMKAEIHRHTNGAVQAGQALDALREQVAEQAARLVAMEKELTRVTEEAAAVQELRQSLAAATQAKTDAEQQLASERGEALRQRVALKTEIDRHMRDAAQADQALADLREQLTEQAARISALELNLTSASARAVDAQTEIDRLATELSSSQDAVKAAERAGAAATEVVELERTQTRHRFFAVWRALTGEDPVDDNVREDRWDMLDRAAAGLFQSISNERRAKEMLRQERDELAARLSEAQQNASLQSRLQLIREGDMRDLQHRYEDLLGRHQQQHDLLAKVAQRLSWATRYYQQLALGQEEPPADDMQEVR